MRTAIRKIALAILVPLAMVGGVALGATAAHAAPLPPVYYVAATSFQFDTDNSLAPSGGDNYYTSTPVKNAVGYEYLGPNGVQLENIGVSGDVGVVVPLGHLDSLTSLNPTIVGSGLEGAHNLYIDTSGDGSYFGSGNSFPYADTAGNLHGDDKFSVSDSTPTLATPHCCGYPGSSTLFANNNPLNLAQIQNAYKTNVIGAPLDPMVWAWYGVGDTAGTSTGYITSVNGVDLVKAVTPPPPVLHPYVYDGHVITVNNNDATVGWSESEHGWPAGDPVKCEMVRVWGYKFSTTSGSPHVGYTCDNGHPGTNEGFLTGLAAGHTYFLQVVPATHVDWGHRADAVPLPGASTSQTEGVNVVTTS